MVGNDKKLHGLDNGDQVAISRDMTFLTSLGFGGDDKPYFGSIATGVLYRTDAGAMTYCDSTANSTGSGAQIGSSGSVSVANNDLALTCTGMPSGVFSLALMGTAPAEVSLMDGYLCVGGPKLFRLEVMVSSDGGSLFYPLDNTDLPNGATIAAGETRNFQFWFRDPGHGDPGDRDPGDGDPPHPGNRGLGPFFSRKNLFWVLNDLGGLASCT